MKNDIKTHKPSAIRHSQEAVNQMKKLFDQFTYRYDSQTVFDALLDFLILCTAIEDETDEKFPKTTAEMFQRKDGFLKRFNDKDKEAFQQVFRKMGEATSNPVTGAPIYYDALGDLFMDRVSSSNEGKGNNDQYFTPQGITDLMTEISSFPEHQDGATVCDPTCGSGRLLLSVAKKNPKLFFFGSDIDHRCVKMTVVNLILNGLQGEIIWGNPLTLKGWKAYQVSKDRIYGVPILRIKKIENSTHFKPLKRKMKERQLAFDF